MSQALPHCHCRNTDQKAIWVVKQYSFSSCQAVTHPPGPHTQPHLGPYGCEPCAVEYQEPHLGHPLTAAYNPKAQLRLVRGSERRKRLSGVSRSVVSTWTKWHNHGAGARAGKPSAGDCSAQEAQIKGQKKKNNKSIIHAKGESQFYCCQNKIPPGA